mmetsp:Transcript_9288/g.8750  ORF Transcript_9288/g.8750 Transcript_9288/m.8750 type:complete len:143 (-) Transcript_9288:1049-1477(-)
MDTVITFWAIVAFDGISRSLVVVISVVVVIPYLLIPLAVSLVILILYFNYAISSLNETQRLDSVHRGPLHQNLIQLTNGLVTFRAYRKVDFYRKDFVKSLEKSTNASFSNVCAGRWIQLRQDFSVLIFALCTVIGCMAFKSI